MDLRHRDAFRLSFLAERRGTGNKHQSRCEAPDDAAGNEDGPRDVGGGCSERFAEGTHDEDDAEKHRSDDRSTPPPIRSAGECHEYGKQ